MFVHKIGAILDPLPLLCGRHVWKPPSPNIRTHYSPSPPLSDFEILGSRSLVDIAGGEDVVVVVDVVEGGSEERSGELVLKGMFWTVALSMSFQEDFLR